MPKINASVDLVPDLPCTIPCLASGVFPRQRVIMRSVKHNYGVPDDLVDYIWGPRAVYSMSAYQRNITREVYNALVRRYSPLNAYATIGIANLTWWELSVLTDGPFLVARYREHTLGDLSGWDDANRSHIAHERLQIGRVVGIILVERNWPPCTDANIRNFVKGLLRGKNTYSTLPVLADMLEEYGIDDPQYLAWMRSVPGIYWCRLSYVIRWGMGRC